MHTSYFDKNDCCELLRLSFKLMVNFGSCAFVNFVHLTITSLASAHAWSYVDNAGGTFVCSFTLVYCVRVSVLTTA